VQRPSDDLLVAFIDGEIDEPHFTEIAAWLERDPSLRARLIGLTEATALLREAFEPDLHNPVPERLSAATLRQFGADVVAFLPKLAQPSRGTRPRWQFGLAAAASFACLVIGVALVHFHKPDGGSAQTMSRRLEILAQYPLQLVDASWTSRGAGPDAQGAVLPDLKPWGLIPVSLHSIVAEGEPVAQHTYLTDNKELGPVTLFVTTSKEPDIEPIFDRHAGVNLLYWRHGGHGYYIVGGANHGWMWGLKNDIAYQLKAL